MKHLIRFEDYGQETKAVALLEEKLGDSLLIFKKKEYIVTDAQLEKLRKNNLRFKVIKSA